MIGIRLRLLAAAAFLVCAGGAAAVEPGEMLRDPALEVRARAISSGLRCLVCQNESIDDSHAELARDIRLLVRQRLVAGAGDAAIRDYLVARYGQFILLRPPVEGATLLLWGMPLLVLAAGGLGIARAFRRRRGATEMARPLTEAERVRLDDLLADVPPARNA